MNTAQRIQRYRMEWAANAPGKPPGCPNPTRSAGAKPPGECGGDCCPETEEEADATDLDRAE